MNSAMDFSRPDSWVYWELNWSRAHIIRFVDVGNLAIAWKILAQPSTAGGPCSLPWPDSVGAVCRPEGQDEGHSLMCAVTPVCSRATDVLPGLQDDYVLPRNLLERVFRALRLLGWHFRVCGKIFSCKWYCKTLEVRILFFFYIIVPRPRGRFPIKKRLCVFV